MTISEFSNVLDRNKRHCCKVIGITLSRCTGTRGMGSSISPGSKFHLQCSINPWRFASVYLYKSHEFLQEKKQPVMLLVWIVYRWLELVVLSVAFHISSTVTRHSDEPAALLAHGVLSDNPINTGSEPPIKLCTCFAATCCAHTCFPKRAGTVSDINNLNPLGF